MEDVFFRLRFLFLYRTCELHFGFLQPFFIFARLDFELEKKLNYWRKCSYLLFIGFLREFFPTMSNSTNLAE